MKMLKLYMDVCCLNRPFDNQEQDRVYLEAETILAILTHCQSGEWTLASSDMIDYELSKLTNASKLEKINAIYKIASERIIVTEQVKIFSHTFQQHGVRLMDSMHLALCETYGQSVLLTTDDNFIKAVSKLKIKTYVANPVTWFMEVTHNEQ